MDVDGAVPGGRDEDGGAAEHHGRHVAAVLQQGVVLVNLPRSVRYSSPIVTIFTFFGEGFY